MSGRAIRSLIRDESGAIAATYALALMALVGIGGVAFDYARLVSVDTELQNAADQAALAAATQLDGKADAITRAQAAVNDYFANSASAVVNRTIMANDGKGSELSGSSQVQFTFYESYNSTTDVFGAATTTGTAAKVVNVTVTGREAFYALTPIVGAFSSGNMNANAVAGIEAATCKLPPLLVCAPPGASFPTAGDIGKGMHLKPVDGAWFPGNFGYVDFGNGGNTVRQLMGTNSTADTCVGGSSVTTEPGTIASATDYLNTRFDIYTNPLTPADCLTNGDYCPARNTRKDLLRKEEYFRNNQEAALNASTGVYTPVTAFDRPACNSAAVTHNGSGITVTDWVQLPPTSLPADNRLQGFPRDNCHVAGSCSGGNIGDGVWDITGYRLANPDVPGSLTTRYEIYKWERDNPGTGLPNTLANSGDSLQATNCQTTGSKLRCDFTWTNYCSYPNPIKGTYHPTPKDRRLMTVAVVDCTGASGKATLPPKNWMDIFLTEPSWPRNSSAESQYIYGEIVSVATKPDGTNAFQYYGRNKAVLLR